MNNNFFRVTAVTPRVYIGNVEKNVCEIKKAYKEYSENSDLIVFPELCLTGYTCGDLFNNRRLIDRAMEGMLELAEFSGDSAYRKTPFIVGLPFEYKGALYNCAALINDGNIEGIVPKTYLPNYGEFYEKRWFSAGKINDSIVEMKNGASTVFGNNLIFRLGMENPVSIGIEICEDAWTPVSPGRLLAVNGAEIIVNISASNEVIGKEQYRRNLIGGISSSCLCGYVYVSAGRYESTSDLVFSGHNLMYENGKLLGENKPFETDVITRDFNLTKIRHDRIANKSFGDTCLDFKDREYVEVECVTMPCRKDEILSKVSMTPFVPRTNKRERCLGIFNMQVAALMRRIETTKAKALVIGVSGGLDSTLALLVAAKAVKNLNLDSKTVIGITMPGFGTTDRTKNNSLALMEKLGCQIREISIVDSVRQHFKDIGHDENVHDITYENCQARERTQILMDVSNKEGGFVIGTGDLSELALGWCTYNGDHMSMYAVNTSIPKTLVKTLVDEIGKELNENGFEGIYDIVADVIDTPVSPELLPPNPDGTIAQKTEDTVGSYVLHDFFLYYTLRYGMAPEEIYTLCKTAVAQSDEYKFCDSEIKKWLNVFYTRFFRQQFKRNCMPDGVKVGTVSVSPRGDLRLPSEVEIEEFLIGDDV